MMKAYTMRVFLPVALAIACTARAADFIDLRAPVPIHGDAAAGHAKAAVCMACHGSAGVASVPTFPDLAGQKIDYLYWQLVEFKRAARADSPMTAQVATLNDVDLRNLSAYFAQLMPVVPGSTREVTRSDHGHELFRRGDPARGIVPCQGCHGADASGHPLASQNARYRSYPVLRGQQIAYVEQRLKDFRNGKNHLSSNDEIMNGIARPLVDDDSIRDLAIWIQAMPR